MTQETASVYEASQTAKKRLETTVRRYARDCAFKVHGDFFLHKTIEIAYLPVWTCAALEEHETPYQVLSTIQGSATNDIVDPLRSVSIGDRVDAIEFAEDATVTEYVALMSVIMELVGDAAFKLLVNRDICTINAPLFPMPFVHMYNGTHEYGYIINKTIVRVNATSYTDLILTWLSACSECHACPTLIADLATSVISAANISTTSVIAQYASE